ncbi:enolase-phosphatase E1-like [Ptychodera flava]|uniref:enolase-phosphatase E1-like n=1 Tax=Ptychodera flava TaxID=63121 RepID=UPI00396A464F
MGNSPSSRARKRKDAAKMDGNKNGSGTVSVKVRKPKKQSQKRDKKSKKDVRSKQKDGAEKSSKTPSAVKNSSGKNSNQKPLKSKEQTTKSDHSDKSKEKTKEPTTKTFEQKAEENVKGNTDDKIEVQEPVAGEALAVGTDGKVETDEASDLAEVLTFIDTVNTESMNGAPVDDLENQPPSMEIIDEANEAGSDRAEDTEKIVGGAVDEDVTESDLIRKERDILKARCDELEANIKTISEKAEVERIDEANEAGSDRAEDTEKIVGGAANEDVTESDLIRKERDILKVRCDELEENIKTISEKAEEERIKILEDEKQQRDTIMREDAALKNKVKDLEKKIEDQKKTISKHTSEIKRLRHLSSSYGTLNEVIEQEMAYMEEKITKLEKENRTLKETIAQ